MFSLPLAVCVLAASTPPPPARQWVVSAPSDAFRTHPDVEYRGVYRDLALGLVDAGAAATAAFKVFATGSSNTSSARFLGADASRGNLFVVEAVGRLELARVQQDPTLHVVGTFGLSAVVAADVWPHVDATLSSAVVPVRKKREEGSDAPLHRLPHRRCRHTPARPPLLAR